MAKLVAAETKAKRLEVCSYEGSILFYHRKRLVKKFPSNFIAKHCDGDELKTIIENIKEQRKTVSIDGDDISLS